MQDPLDEENAYSAPAPVSTPPRAATAAPTWTPPARGGAPVASPASVMPEPATTSAFSRAPNPVNPFAVPQKVPWRLAGGWWPEGWREKGLLDLSYVRVQFRKCTSEFRWWLQWVPGCWQATTMDQLGRQ